MVNIALTGGTGFAGRCFIEEVLRTTDWKIHSFVRPGWNRDDSDRIEFYDWDFREPFPFRLKDDFQFFVHMGAAVHALRSLEDPEAFCRSNIMGTLNALEACRNLRGNPDFVYISTAEVLGGRRHGYSVEDDPLQPSNPYAASKAAGELLTQTYHRCYKMPTIIVRTMNLYDMEKQNDESKFVPMVKKAILAGETVKIHTSEGLPGSRQWITGDGFAEELLDLLTSCADEELELGKPYHVVGEELSNLEMAKLVADHLNATLKYEHVPMPPTHEFRYAMRSTR